jgi:hypothetical protein
MALDEDAYATGNRRRGVKGEEAMSTSIHGQPADLTQKSHFKSMAWVNFALKIL